MIYRAMGRSRSARTWRETLPYPVDTYIYYLLLLYSYKILQLIAIHPQKKMNVLIKMILVLHEER